MTVVSLDALASRPPEPKRDTYQRYLIKPQGGGRAVAHTRVTTVANVLDDRYSIEKWQQRMVALGLVVRQDLYALVASTPADDKKTLNRLCAQAQEAAKSSAGANVGTALHRFTERLDRGEDVFVPPPWDADVATYRKTLVAAGITIDANLIERVAVVEGLSEPIAGMADRFARNGNAVHITADLKTGVNLNYSWWAIAIQLALYSRATSLYDPITETHEPMPPVDQERAIVIHLPAGQATCTLYEVDIEAGWEAAQYALWVRQWRQRKDLARSFTVPGLNESVGRVGAIGTATGAPPPELMAPAPSVTPPTGPVPDPSRLRIRLRALIDAGHAETIVARWPHQVPTLKHDGHSEDHLWRINELLGDLERRYNLPFTDEPESAKVIDLFDAPTSYQKDVKSPLLNDPQPVQPKGPDPALRAELEALGFDEARALLVAVCFRHKAYEAITADEWTAIAALLHGIDVGAVAFIYDDRGPTAVTTDKAHPLIVAAHGTPAATLERAKTIASIYGRPKPRSVASAANDPVITALLLHNHTLKGT